MATGGRGQGWTRPPGYGAPSEVMSRGQPAEAGRETPPARPPPRPGAGPVRLWTDPLTAAARGRGLVQPARPGTPGCRRGSRLADRSRRHSRDRTRDAAPSPEPLPRQPSPLTLPPSHATEPTPEMRPDSAAPAE